MDEENMEPSSNRERPIRLMAGATVRGPIYRRRKPIRPNAPMTTWNRQAVIIAPWI